MKTILIFITIISSYLTFGQSQIINEIKKVDESIPNYTGWQDVTFKDLLIKKQSIDEEVFTIFSKELSDSKNIIYYISLGSLPSNGNIHKGCNIKIKELDTNETYHFSFTEVDNNRVPSHKEKDDFNEEYFDFISNDYLTTKGQNILRYTDNSESFHSLDYHTIEFIYEIHLNKESKGMIFNSFNYYASEKLMNDFFNEE